MTIHSTPGLKTRILDNSSPEALTGCWLWTGAITGSGYATISVRNRQEMGHRASYVAFRGPIPGKLQVLHSCDVPTCVNPDPIYSWALKETTCTMPSRNTGTPWESARFTQD